MLYAAIIGLPIVAFVVGAFLVYNATFVDHSLYERDVLNGNEPEIGSSFVAEWRSLNDLQLGSDSLVADGLASLIAGFGN